MLLARHRSSHSLRGAAGLLLSASALALAAFMPRMAAAETVTFLRQHLQGP